MLKVIVMASLAIVLASSALAQMKDMPMEHKGPGHTEMCNMCGMDGKGDMMGGMMDKCLQNADKIGLTDDQLNKIKPIHREMQKKQAQYMADLKIAQIEMMEIMDVKDFDLEKATVQVKKIADIKTAQHLEMLKSMKQVHSILTEEQFKKMKKMMPMMMEEHTPPKKMMKKK